MEILQFYREKYPSEHCRHYPCPYIATVQNRQDELRFMLYAIRAAWSANIAEWNNRQLTCRLCAMETVIWDILRDPAEEEKYRNSDVLEFTRCYVHCLNTYKLHYGLHYTQNRWTRFIKSFRTPYQIDKPLVWTLLSPFIGVDQ